MLDRAMRAFHSHGLIHRVSIQSIGTMMLLFWLWENTHPQALTEARMLTAMALEQMRIMVDHEQDYPKEDVKEIRGGRLFWTVLVAEATASAHSSRQLQMSDDDIKMFFPSLLRHEQPQLLHNSDRDLFFSVAAVRLYGDLAMTARRISETLSSPLARKKELDLGTLESIWKSIDAHANLCAIVQRQISLHPEGIPKITQSWIGTLVCARAGLDKLIDSVLQDRWNGYKRVEGEEKVNLLESLTQHARSRTFSAILQLCGVLKDGQKESRAIAFGGILLLSLEGFIDQLLDEPAAEEGSCLHFTNSLGTKLMVSRWRRIIHSR
jgi:hypothetical protein